MTNPDNSALPPGSDQDGRRNAWLRDARNLPYLILGGLMLVSLLARLILMV